MATTSLAGMDAVLKEAVTDWMNAGLERYMGEGLTRPQALVAVMLVGLGGCRVGSAMTDALYETDVLATMLKGDD